MMKKLLATLVVAILICSITAGAVGLLKPTMRVTVYNSQYTIEVSGLNRTQSQELEKIINYYLDSLDKNCPGDDSYTEVYEPTNMVYLVRNNKLYHIAEGKETYIDTVCSGEIGIDAYNNVVYINEDYKAKYIYNTNDYPTKTKNITSSAKNLVKQGNVVTGVDYASGKTTKTNTSFIKDAGNELPVVVYEQVGSSLRAIKCGEFIRITSLVSTKAENPVAVTKSGKLVYVTSTGYLYGIGDVENITEIKTTTPKKVAAGGIYDLVISSGTATAYVHSYGKTAEIE